MDMCECTYCMNVIINLWKRQNKKIRLGSLHISRPIPDRIFRQELGNRRKVIVVSSGLWRSAGLSFVLCRPAGLMSGLWRSAGLSPWLCRSVVSSDLGWLVGLFASSVEPGLLRRVTKAVGKCVASGVLATDPQTYFRRDCIRNLKL
jgi:hypothetical protein